MPKSLMSSTQQAELQGQVWKTLEAYRQKHDLSPAALFDFLVCFAWGYARRQPNTPNVEIVNRMRAHCEACELAFQKATAPDPERAALASLGRIELLRRGRQ